ncbi:protein LMBR1L-like isoform X2 [Mizuhopecten yessoensis]|uniref:Protein LMBR1L n=1 Tax=Mizuhopecten yessoensis TaxID=6573 RepID=A0A210QNX9_MIZYE|nr:protein LMBR1L-like isoform X2 [Mizuhopecten yessoensis]OWF50439.1 Protein LMBR1L [Mizuhopecten yessoensis]
MENDVDVDKREEVFHNAVREYIIFMLLFILLYVSSYITICYFKRKADSDDTYAGGEEDAVVYRIALWLCTFTLSVSVGAVLLLPISIISNEVLHHYPKSYYVKWLNSSLIHGLWNMQFAMSNVSLFFFMPFAYFFTESEGFVGYKKGVMARVYESVIVLFLLTLVIVGCVWVVSACFDEDVHKKQRLFDIWNFYLPYIYAIISFIGVIVLLLCTPVGFARMFTVMGKLVVKPKFLRDIDEEFATLKMQEESIRRKIDCELHHQHSTIANGHATSGSLQKQLEEIEKDKAELEKRKKISPLRRNLGYPLVILALLALTVLCVLSVAHHFFELLVGIKALPVGAKETVLGISSLSALGSVGAVLEIVLILYVMSASIEGFYSLPFFRRLTPEPHNTSMVQTIGNCVVLLILSSALPVLSRIMGITNFDLIGNFGSMDWLGNFYLILTCNAVFATTTTMCLTNKFTGTVRSEVFNRLWTWVSQKEKKQKPQSYTSFKDD